MKILLNIIITICVAMSLYILYKDNYTLKNELAFVREANEYKHEALKYADSCMMATDNLIEELEQNNLLPDESDNLEDYLIYKHKLDSMYAQEL